ncbi:ROK family transcriptional regulator [Planosporangium flavigriseum]|uniref:Transcriptional regulator n=1 Tax=Planosporangium flavigriseum TaxID=373681 RepID=A0A8J3LXE5_9ACTN|nr:ROK family transcriptional regulator [Planosporangium flavigriseum]NJC64965.1 ROK family transcriptional regulator [Planosporangium flavigriseum]GIG72840.1 transcriptional regulator [Planosporangium flavigriseum]
MSRLAGSSKLLRAMNEGAALTYLLERGRLTRADLRELTGLSKPTISEALRRLTEAGLARVVGHLSGRPGPNAEVYAANPDAAYAIAVSVRSNGDLAGAVSDLSGQVRGRADEAVDFGRVDPVDAVAGIIRRLRNAAGLPADRLTHVQLAVPASYDARTESFHHVGVAGDWHRPGLVSEVRHRLGTGVGIDNDVNLAAVAERRRGAARGADGFALLWLGDDGLGLAIDLGGTLLRGARGGAGEIGYLPLFSPGHEDSGLNLQDLVGGAGVLALAAEHGFGGPTPAAAVTAAAAAVTRGTAAAAAAAASPAAAPFFSALASRITVGLAAVVAVLDPPLVVLAGEVAQAGGPALRDAVAAAMVRAEPLETTIATTAIDDDAVLLGALDAGVTAVHEELISRVAR